MDLSESMSPLAETHKRLKVAYLNFSNSGGMLHYVLNLAEAAAKYVDSAYIDVGVSPTRAYTITGRPVLFFPWPAGGRLISAYQKYHSKNFRDLARHIAANINPDIVHITSTSLGLLSLVKHLRRLGIRVVYTIHDPQPHHENRTLWGTIYTYYQEYVQSKLAYRHCNALHVHSTLHTAIVGEYYGTSIRAKTYIVAHGGGATADLIKGELTPPELIDRPQTNKIKFLFFGRIEPYKGIKYLLQAQHFLIDTGLNCEVIIAGSGQLPTDVSLPANTLLLNRFVADNEVRALIEYSDVVVLPYTEATQSGVIPLAYHFGKPVICTRVGALPEMVIDHQTGVLIPPRNAEALADAMQLFVTDKSLALAWGQHARRMLDETLSWERVVSSHYANYLQLLNTKACDTASKSTYLKVN